MIEFTTKQKGKDTSKFLKNLKKRKYLERLNKYGQQGVEALSSVTPVDTGLTASSWYYTIAENQNGVSIYWSNSNIVKGLQTAVLLEYGHGTRNGGYVEGRHYISPAIQPIFDKIAKDAWREVTES